MTPDFRLHFNGSNITAQVRDRLISLRIKDEAGIKSDTIDLVIDDRDGVVEIPPAGGELEAWLGYKETGLTKIGTFVIDEVEYAGSPRTLTARGKAASFEAGPRLGTIQAQKSRSWHGITIGALVQKIASEHGYTPAVSDKLAAVQIPHMDQTGESDMHLLTRLAAQHGAVAKPAERFLIFAEQGKAESVTGKAMPTVSLTLEDLEPGWRATFNERQKFQKVVARWHDKAGATERTVEAGSGDKVYFLPDTYPTEAEARSAAEAKLAALQQGAGVLTFTTAGRVDLVAEGRVNLGGVRAGVNGAWTSKSIEQDYSASGWLTHGEAERKGG